MAAKELADRASTVRLSYRPPFDWDFFLAFHAARALPGVEHVSCRSYWRVVRVGDYLGCLQVTGAAADSLSATLMPADDGALATLVPALRRAFDLDADPAQVQAGLAHDVLLQPLLAARPGLRVAGSVDPFEQAVRAILGQQISVVAARNLGGRLAARWGTPLPGANDDRLAFAFPTAAVLADADVGSLGMPGKRGAAVSRLAAQLLATPDLFARADSLGASIAKLEALPGLGPWTAHYIAMRALREPDAFPASDVGLLRAWGELSGARVSVTEFSARAECWRPWRAYAAQHLWAHGAAPIAGTATVRQ